MHDIYTYIYIYINNILYIVSTPTCFDAYALSSSGSLNLVLAKVTKLLKLSNLQLKISRLKYSRDRFCMIKCIKL